MLKLFQISDLHGPPSHTSSDNANPSSDPQSRRGIIQISSSDYDSLATDHPRARLTYMDDDDGEIITVGSSFELSQRLEEPVPLASLPTSNYSDPSSPSYPIHIFDIRRSKSVSDLWKKYEYKPDVQIGQIAHVTNTERQDHTPPEPSSQHENVENPATAPDSRETEPLLTAFEAQMASIWRASENLNRAHEQQTTADPQTQEAPRSNSAQSQEDRLRCAIRTFADVAEGVRSGVVSRLPEFERQLQETLSDPLVSAQSALVALENQARGIANRSGTNIFQGGLPTTSEAVSGLRDLAAEVGGLSQSLFEAFESEIRRCSREQNRGPPTDTSAPIFSPNARPTPVPTHEIPSMRTESGQAMPTQDRDAQVHNSVPQHQAQPFAGAYISHNILPLPYRPRTEQPSSSYNPPRIPDSPAPMAPVSQPVGVHSSPLQHTPISNVLFVGNVGFGVHEAMIYHVFSSKGFAPAVQLSRYPGGQHAGFGFLKFGSDKEARDALEALQGTHIDGHAINLEFCEQGSVTEHFGPQPWMPSQNLTPPDGTHERRHHGFAEQDRGNARSHRAAPLSVADLCVSDSRHTLEETTADSNPGSSSQSDTQRLNALYPSLLPENFIPPQPVAPDPPNGRGFDAFSERRRFPPFSQPETRFLSERAGSSSSAAQLHRDNNRNDVTPGSLPGSFPLDPRDVVEPRLARRHRSLPLYRCGSHAPSNAGHHQDHHSQSSNGVSRPPTQRQQSIDECIATLASLGYGDAEEGGLQRIAVYAAAVDGSVSDAIEMIEEERKAYELQDDSR
ncbi:hypothetical protein BDV59DRAFT_49943 [Aspergillus ambiguus]|uniref:uncharacterized protein n=1 Tax=Aspergillus ambiguus TaxID=176160 RepID=UPI003CCD10A4